MYLVMSLMFGVLALVFAIPLGALGARAGLYLLWAYSISMWRGGAPDRRWSSCKR